jgi:hypothetical protein
MLQWWRGRPERRVMLHPGDLGRSRRFNRDVLGLAVYRACGPPDDSGLVFFLGQVAVPGRALGDDLGPGPRCSSRARLS